MGKDLTFGSPLSGFTARSGKLSMAPNSVTGPSGFKAFIYQCALNVDWDGAHKCYGLDRPDETGPNGQKFPLQKNLHPWESGEVKGSSLLNARVKGSAANAWSSVYIATRDHALRLLNDHFPGFSSFDQKRKDDILAQFRDNRTHTAWGSLENQPGDGKFPIVQLREMGQPQPGYYVSTSLAFDKTNPHEWDQGRYLDAGEVPYSVVPALAGVGMGDFGLVIHNKTGKNTPFLFGDSSGAKGGSKTLGESSGFAWQTLGQHEDDVHSFIVFPGSGDGTTGSDALDRMGTIVRAMLGKLTDDDLAKKLAPRDPELYNVRRALFENNGPTPSNNREFYPREHGGPETHDEDFPKDDDYRKSGRPTLTGH